MLLTIYKVVAGEGADVVAGEGAVAVAGGDTMVAGEGADRSSHYRPFYY